MPFFARAKDDPKKTSADEAVIPNPLAGAPAPGPGGLRQLEDHREYLLSRVTALNPFGIGVLDACGLTLCENLIADIDLPIFTAATQDGWAVRASNLVGASELHPIVLPVVAHIQAGDVRPEPLSAGTAVRVAAGAPVPEGADAVLPLAEGHVLEDEVYFRAEARFQQNLLLAGARVADGDRLLSRGDQLSPRALALIAEVGNDKVLARPKPRVAVLTAAGDLVEPGLPLTKLTERYDATTVLVAAGLREDGATVYPAGLVAPVPTAVAAALNDQLVRADMLVLLADITDDLVAELTALGPIDVAAVDGFAEQLAFGLVGADRIPLIVLPVAPVPAFLAYSLFTRPLVQKLSGGVVTEPELVERPLSSELSLDPSSSRLVLGQTTSAGARPLPFFGEQGAAELCQADVVIVVPPGDAVLSAGSLVDCWPLG